MKGAPTLPSIPTPSNSLERVSREIDRNIQRARNGIKLAVGTSRPTFGWTPKDVVWRGGRCELWRYPGPRGPGGAPLLFVFTLVNRTDIPDLARGTRFVLRPLAAAYHVRQ